MKQKILNIINGPIMRAFGRMGSQRHLLSIRNGIIATIPFVILGATALLILNIPIKHIVDESKGIDKWEYLSSYMPALLNNMLLYTYRFSMGVMGLMAAWGIASELGKTYKLSQTTAGLMGAFGYLMLFIPVNGGTIVLGSLGGGSLFSAIVGAIVSVEIMHFMIRFKISIRMPKGVPDAVSNSFASLLPAIVVGTLFGVLRYIVGFDVNGFLSDVFNPMKNFLVGGLWGGLVIIVFVTLFWWVGIHGTSLISSVIRPLWQDALTENGKWAADGFNGPMPYRVPEQFLQWFVWIGGAGATLGFLIAGLIFARSQQLKSITRVSFVPGIFNINEPVIFGTPIILNPFMLIPFMLAPIAMAVVGYLLMIWWGVYMWAATAWTLPSPVGAFFSAGSNWKAIMISLINILISFAIWTPFVIIYDRKLRKLEKSGIVGEKLTNEQIKEAKERAKGKKVVKNA